MKRRDFTKKTATTIGAGFTTSLMGFGINRNLRKDENIKGWVKDTGFVTIMEGDKVISNPGGTAPEYVDGKLQPMYQDSQIFNHGHDVCVDEDTGKSLTN